MNDYIKEVIKGHPELTEKVCAYGFCFTNDEINEDRVPFIKNWQKNNYGKYSLYVHPKQHFFMAKDFRTTVILVGHAYNPFSFEYREEEILAELLNCYHNNKKEFIRKINQLTGIFTIIWIKGENIFVVGDATCMQSTFLCLKNSKVYISSHTNIIGDILQLEWSEYSKRLISYKFFPLLGYALPGNLTQFCEIKRLVPNHIVKIHNNVISWKRFYAPYKTKKTDEEIETEAAKILHQSMMLIIKKWQRPAISLTGGCDSKTTLACAKDLYDKFSFFSYISSEAEKVDAEAASRIAAALGIKHKIYMIPENDNDQSFMEEVRSIMDYNTGNIIPHNKNDVRKRRYFCEIEEFDVEVKSWASEIGRAYYSKRFHGRKNFGKIPTPRICTTLYKFFLHNRKLVRETDEVFGKYLKQFFMLDKRNPVEWQEQFFWEYRVPSWNGLVITQEQRLSYDITIPYNNRILLNMFLSTTIDNRINDILYSGIRHKMNPAIDKTGIAVQNLKHTKIREQFENLYYIFNCIVP